MAAARAAAFRWLDSPLALGCIRSHTHPRLQAPVAFVPSAITFRPSSSRRVMAAKQSSTSLMGISRARCLRAEECVQPIIGEQHGIAG
jgi:hypothetical protein